MGKGPPSRNSLYSQAPLTYSASTTPGEETIAAATTAPSLVTHGFVVAGVDGGAGSAQFRGPNLLSVCVELSGASAAAAEVNFSLWFWLPHAATANKWRETAAFVAAGPDKRGAKGADAGVQNGNVYEIPTPPGASRGFVHVQTLAANVNVHVLVVPAH